MNRIIVNWMYPRSLTTVFMRAITNRGDFHTIFEPTLPLYWRDRKEAGVQSHQDYEGWPVVYEEIIKKIYGIAEKSPDPSSRNARTTPLTSIWQMKRICAAARTCSRFAIQSMWCSRSGRLSAPSAPCA